MRTKGFTLIELSIVLLIIGLVIGGVLVGQDLIQAAGVRATVTQIEKYNQAVNTFKGKYGELPGDMTQATSSQFGFAARGPYAGQGDGNGVIQGNYNNGTGNNFGNSMGAGETVMFWSDLTYANGMNLGLIEGSFKTASPTSVPNSIGGAQLALYFPQAKLGGGNYVYAWSGGQNGGSGYGDYTNYYTVSALTSVNNLGQPFSNATLTVRQSYSMDAKIDDGLPQSGKVVALYLANITPYWAGTTPLNNNAPYTTATAGTSSTCFDNGNSAGAAQAYSLGQNNGNGANCALSFKFQ